ncbi:acyloxyacyl hydrolase [Ideonella azotifigens]|nr:acyloxyacyl hydrolase [Ideonella azotifigens]MCD2343047.1 acyloxyacyl hydrolase [Ideonella azotifigens]
MPSLPSPISPRAKRTFGRTFGHSISTRRARFGAQAVACLSILLSAPLMAQTAPASPKEHASSNGLRAVAVAGTLASWAYAWWEGAPFTRCDGAPRWQFRGNVAKDDELRVATVGAAYGECQMLTAGGWSLSNQTNFSVSRWSAQGDVAFAKNAWDVAIVPLVHWQRPAFGATRMEVEFGIGPAWLSQTNIGDRQKSTQYQFSDHLGLNLVDAGGAWRVGLHWRHISNLDIKTPNNGVDFAGVVVAFSL